MRRRALLAGCSTFLTGVLAGCGGGGGDGDGGSDGDTPTESEPTPTRTPETTPTENPTPTQTSTPTATPTETTPSDELTHEIDEEFTVGEGNNAVGYRIIRYFRADKLGSEVEFQSADGTYLIVVLELRNPGNKGLSISRDDFRVRTASSWAKFDPDATRKVRGDARLDVNPIGDTTISPGESQVGAVVFDLDPEETYRLWITPTGEADTPEHFVPIGDISSVEELQTSLTG